jgi:hypothetical protein
MLAPMRRGSWLNPFPRFMDSCTEAAVAVAILWALTRLSARGVRNRRPPFKPAVLIASLLSRTFVGSQVERRGLWKNWLLV